MPKTAFSTGPKYPTTTTTTNGSGSSGQWSNPANIFAADANNAASAYLGPPTFTDDLKGAGFNLGIPNNAVIDGIMLEMRVPSSARWDESGSFLRLAKAGVATGTNQAGNGSATSNVWRYGGSSNLWGTTWTPAELNAANFGFSFAAAYTSSPADFAIAVDYVRVTVFWHYSSSVAPADVPKRYLYKVFNKGAYLGNLPKVGSKFAFTQDINSSGTSLNIECGVSADTAGERGSRLVTEAGEPITTELGEHIYTDGQPPILGTGDAIDPLIIQNGNRIEVWEYSYYYPNGKLMFVGQVNSIEAGFGSSAENKIKMLVLSDGLDLANLIARGSPFAYTPDAQQPYWDHPTWSTITQSDKGGMWNRYGQTWVVGNNVTKLGAIDLMLNGAADVTVTVYDGFSGTVIGSVTKAVDTTLTSVVPVQFAFSNLIPVAPNGTYFFTVSVESGQSMVIHHLPGNPYPNGSMYNSSYGGGGGGGYTEMTGSDLYFITYSGAATTTATYTNKDPATGMLKPIIDDYKARGGLISYSPDSIDPTGLSLTATFNTETILDAIKKCLSIAPSGYYFYVDVGTDIIYFKDTPTSPTYRITKGRHMNKINLKMSIENVKNDLLFSGAEIAGTNVYTEYADQQSQSNYGSRLERKSDNRVSLQPTADAIGTSFIEENRNEYYETTITVLDTTMDITLFKPGQVVALKGFGSFIDKLQLQIVRIEYFPDYVNLTLGNLPKRFTSEFETLLRGLVAEQTVANPAAPS